MAKKSPSLDLARLAPSPVPGAAASGRGQGRDRDQGALAERAASDDTRPPPAPDHILGQGQGRTGDRGPTGVEAAEDTAPIDDPIPGVDRDRPTIEDKIRVHVVY